MYKSRRNQGLFDEEFTKKRLSIMGNPLESISKVIDFELFRELLEIKLFNILILQRYYGLGDNQVEYQILDRTNFKSFLGLSMGDKIPDEKTIWSFRERVTKKGLVEESVLKEILK